MSTTAVPTLEQRQARIREILSRHSSPSILPPVIRAEEEAEREMPSDVLRSRALPEWDRKRMVRHVRTIIAYTERLPEVLEALHKGDEESLRQARRAATFINYAADDIKHYLDLAAARPLDEVRR